jgi:hypothetical protein
MKQARSSVALQEGNDMIPRAKLWPVAVAALFATAAAVRISAADRIAYQGRLVIGSRGIIVMSAAGSNPVEIPLPAGSDRITPALSPDGIRVAYAAKSGESYKLWIAALANDNSLATDPMQLTTGTSDDEQPSWSPDGRRIAYVSGSGEQRAIYTIAADGGEAAKVVDLGGDFRTACPHWTPDGSRIVFSSEGKVFIVDAAGGTPKQMLDDGSYPSFSPDGNQMAFFRLKPEPALCVVPRTGGEPRVLVRDIEFFGETAWSPDGKAIAFKADKVGGVAGGLWTVAAAGGSAKPLRSYGVAHGYLDWAGPVTVATAPPSTAPRPEKPTTAAAVAAAPKPTAVAQPAVKAPAAPVAQPAATKPTVPVQKPSPPPAAPERLTPLPPVIAAKPPEAAAQQAPVRIVSPAEGAAVRGITRVTASKTSPGGYMTFLVDGAFVQATIAPYQMEWDTRPVGDGPHTIAVTAYSASGGLEGTAELRVEVRNAIGQEAAPQEGITLRYRYKPKEKWDYDVTVTATAGNKGEVPLPQVAAQGGTIQALMTQRVESVKDVVPGEAASGAGATAPQQRSAAGQAAPPQQGKPQTVATLISQIRSGRLDAPGAGGRLPQAGQAARSTRTPDGAVAVIAQPNTEPIALGNLAIMLPKDPVKVGDKWTAPMTILPLLRSNAVARVTAEHKIDSMQWEGGLETVKIVSTFKVASLPVGLAGMALEKVSGTRTTWFAYKEHRVVRVEDNLEGTFNQKAAMTAAAKTATTGYARTAPAGGAAQAGAAAPAQRRATGGIGGLSIRLGGRRSGSTGTAARPTTPTRPAVPSGGLRIGLGGRRGGTIGSATGPSNPWQVGGQARRPASPYQPGVQARAPLGAAAAAQPAAAPSAVVHYSLNLVEALKK